VGIFRQFSGNAPFFCENMTFIAWFFHFPPLEWNSDNSRPDFVNRNSHVFGFPFQDFLSSTCNTQIAREVG
jgi:hypothetical protein